MPELARQRADGVIDRSKTRDTPCFPLAAKGRLGVWNSHRGNHLGQRSCASAKTGRTYGRKRSDQSTAQITLRGGGRSLIASPLSMIFLVAAPGHGSLRGRNNPPQHLVRSTGAAMSTTSWHTMTPLKAHSRSHPYPRPAAIRNLARMNLTNNGVRPLLRAPTSGTALPNARHYAR
jgi:hypothetical protein